MRLECHTASLVFSTFSRNLEKLSSAEAKLGDPLVRQKNQRHLNSFQFAIQEAQMLHYGLVSFIQLSKVEVNNCIFVRVSKFE